MNFSYQSIPAYTGLTSCQDAYICLLYRLPRLHLFLFLSLNMLNPDYFIYILIIAYTMCAGGISLNFGLNLQQDTITKDLSSPLGMAFSKTAKPNTTSKTWRFN